MELVPGLVSIITAWYNREDQVKKSIESLLNQTYEQIEIIAVDDGSTDGTLGELLSFSDSRLKVISQENQGFVRAIRRAISESRGEYVAMHDAGDISLPTRIEKEVRVLREDPAVGMVGCYVEHFDPQTGTSVMAATDIDQSIPLLRQLLEGNIFSHGEVMYRRSLYERVGGYRVFFEFAQDHDLWLRMSQYARAAKVPEKLYVRYAFPDGVSVAYRKRARQMCLSDFAVACARRRLTHGKDFLEEYGVIGIRFRPRSPQLARRLSGLAHQAIRNGEMNDAYWIVGLSIKEKVIPRNVFLGFLLWCTVRKSWLSADQLRALMHATHRIISWLRSALGPGRVAT